MDLDEELSFLSDDKIQKFFVSKLQEISGQNQALEAVLKERKKEIQELTKKSPQEIQIKHLWKNSINHKLIIGFEVICQGTFSNIQVILGILPEAESFNYITQTYSLNNLVLSENNSSLIPGYLNRTQIFENQALVTIFFDVPCYTQKTEYALKGHVFCTVNNEEVTTSIETQISFKDSSIKQYKLDSVQILLSSVASCMETVLLMIFPKEWNIPLISTFEINCLLTYTAINEKIGYFIANKISENFNGTIMIPQYPENKKTDSNNTVVFLQVYTSCDQQLFAFLHHLLSRVQNSIILPQIFSHIIDDVNKNEYSSYEEKKIILNKFKENMLKEISLGHDSCKWLKPEMFNLQDARKKLLQQETETDLNYLKLIRM